MTAIALARLGKVREAALLMGAGDAERKRTGLVIEPPDRPLLEEAVQRARSLLGDGWDTEFEKGWAMSLEEALELAASEAAGGS